MLRILTSFLATFLLSCCILFSKTDVKNVVVDIKPNDSGITEENGGKVKSSIKALWEEMWNDYEDSKSQNPKDLPDCIYQIVDEYKKWIGEIWGRFLTI